MFFKNTLQIIGLYLLNWIGTWIQKLCHLPVSGSIIGLVLLFLLLIFKLLPEKSLEGGARTLLKLLPFLFLPSVLGVMKEGPFLKHEGFLFGGLVLISTFLTMGTTAWVTERVSSLKKQKVEEEHSP